MNNMAWLQLAVFLTLLLALAWPLARSRVRKTAS